MNRRFVEACRRTRTILPATTTIERLCADALVDAERRIEGRIAERVPPGLRRDLEHLLEETGRRRRDAVCAAEWESFVADAVVKTHDRIVGRTYREAARTSEAQLGDEAAAVREALRAFAGAGDGSC